ncbi:hypothetical protein EI94DRAFT_242838 [Lactarius quietus]|nr:hypothetical protein EI94DRAFT_242838 [Lactarius quietus]
MPGDDTKDLESSSPASFEVVTVVSESGQTESVGSTESTQENHNHDRSVDVEATPPLGVKLTVYRLLNMATMFSFCVAKGILTYDGVSTLPTTLDWVSGGVLADILYWVGLYESRDSKKWGWFFQVDLAPGICTFSKHVVGGALWLLFFDNNLFIISLNGSVSGLLAGLLSYFPSHMSVVGKLGIILGIIVLVFGFQYCIGVLTRQVRAQAWASRWAIDLVDNYGHGAPLAERYCGRHSSLCLLSWPNL